MEVGGGVLTLGNHSRSLVIPIVVAVSYFTFGWWTLEGLVHDAWKSLTVCCKLKCFTVCCMCLLHHTFSKIMDSIGNTMKLLILGFGNFYVSKSLIFKILFIWWSFVNVFSFPETDPTVGLQVCSEVKLAKINSVFVTVTAFYFCFNSFRHVQFTFLTVTSFGSSSLFKCRYLLFICFLGYFQNFCNWPFLYRWLGHRLRVFDFGLWIPSAQKRCHFWFWWLVYQGLTLFNFNRFN